MGIEERPTVVTPNQQEADRLLGRTLLTRTHYLEAAERIRTMGPESVVLSLGSRGAVGAFREGIFEALPPRVDAVCPIGAGDALSAAYTWAMERKNNWVEALRWGVAAGTASARLPGMKFASLEQTQEIVQAGGTAAFGIGVTLPVVMLLDLKLVIRLQEIDNRLAELAREIASCPNTSLKSRKS